MSNNKYKVTSSTFKGKTSSGDYCYEITFNKSLQHTGKFRAIEDGLNKYDKKELIRDVAMNAKGLCISIKRLFYKGGEQ